MNWKNFALGIYDQAEPANDEEQNLIAEATAHLKDVNEFKAFYNREQFGESPEHQIGFPLDNRLQEVLRLIRMQNAKTILDVGCRTGFLLFHMATRALLTYGRGVDINTSSIKTCNTVAERLNLTHKLSFTEAMFEDYTDDRAYDIGVMTDVLEHCISPETFLKKAREFTGKLVISVPVDCPNIPGRPNDWKHQEHVRVIDKDAAQKLFADTGWKAINYSSLTSYFLTDIYVLQQIG